MPTNPKKHILLKSILLLIFLMVAASSASALPVAGEFVTMLNDSDLPYSMQYGEEVYSTFCLEHDNYFTPGSTYKVQSVGDTAYGGGTGIGGDPVSDETKWLYAAFMSDLLYDTDILGGATADAVQKTIWFLENENGGVYYSDLFANYSNFDASDWVVVAVNLTTRSGEDIQSQLVGYRVPEPATLMLLGTGLLGIGLITRRKIQK